MKEQKKDLEDLLKELSDLQKRIQELESDNNSGTDIDQDRLFLRTIIDNLPDAIYVKDKEARKIIANLTDVKNLGLNSEEELLSKTDFDFYPMEIAEGFLADDRSVLQTGKAVINREEFFIDKAGKKHWLLTSKIPLKNHDNNIVGIIGIGRDITERKGAEELLQVSETRYRRLFESAKDGILILNAQTGKIVDVNPFLIELLGYSKEEFLEKEIWEIGTFKNIVANKDKFFELQQKKFVRYEDLPLESSDGRTVNVEFVSNTYLVANQEVIQCNIRDITERKRNEEKIISLNRVYAVLSNVNKMMVRVTQLKELFNETCNIAVEKGEYTVVWLGTVDQERKIVNPIAWNNTAKGYFTDLIIPLNKEDDNFGTAGKVVLENHYIVNNNIKSDESLGFRRAIAIEMELHSVASFPLRYNSQVFAVLSFYSKNINHFDEDEIRLLEELSEDISFAYYSIKQEEIRCKVEEQLQINEVRYHNLFENAAVAIWEEDLSDTRGYIDELKRKGIKDFRTYFNSRIDEVIKCASMVKLLDVNKEGQEIFKAGSKKEILINLASFFIDESMDAARNELISLAEDKLRIEGEMPVKILNGEVKQILFQLSIVPGYEDTWSKVLFSFIDITDRKLNEEKILKLSHAIEQSPALVLITNRDGIIEYVNKKFCTVTGYTMEEVLGKNPSIMKSGLQNKEYYKNLWNTILAGKEWKGQLQNKKKNGDLYWESALISPLVNVNGDITNFIAVKEDITAFKENENKLLDSEKRYRELFEKMLDGVYKSTHEGKFIQVNEALVHMLGYNSKEELYDIDIKSQLYFQEADRESAALEEKSEEMAIFRIKKKDGSGIWIEDHGRHVLDDKGNVLYHEGVMRDVTERHKMEEELIKAKNYAEEMNRIKNNFLANMSHELRTPLIGILGYAEFLMAELKDKELIEMADIIRKSGKRLNQTLNNLLDISKIEAEKEITNIKKQDLLKFINEQVKLFLPVAEAKNLVLKLDTRAQTLNADIDEGLFISIINNLINNAVKYTDRGEITVTAMQKDNKAVIEVNDTGIGVPLEFQEIIFDPFRQASEGLNRKYEGTGLGLTLAKKYAALLGGQLTLKSQPGAGSTFKLILPLADADNEDLFNAIQG